MLGFKEEEQIKEHWNMLQKVLTDKPKTHEEYILLLLLKDYLADELKNLTGRVITDITVERSDLEAGGPTNLEEDGWLNRTGTFITSNKEDCKFIHSFLNDRGL